ncbi:cell division protein FtsQ [Kerstersia sp.]|uniref:cell division protein FtsQ n=1 Tax=Kerstersia sp. TaxID=1930783 RepID=UPI003F93E8CC
MTRSLQCLAAATLMSSLALSSQAADIALYETGPAEDSSFLRFVNGSDATIRIASGNAGSAMELAADEPASKFFAVRAGQPLKGEIRAGDAVIPTQTTVQPGDFVSVIVTQAADGQPQATTITESPEDFNALKAAVAFYNLDPGCADAVVRVAGRDTALFSGTHEKNAPPRRQINPVPLSVQLVCAGQDTGAVLDLGKLQAGERYTLFLVPGHEAKQSRLFYAVDSLAF